MLRHPAIRWFPLGCALAGLLLGAAMPALGPGARASEALLWGDLESGPYAVGFMAIEKYDYGRSFEPKRNYFGEMIPGEKARPIQICVWYPAAEPGDAMALVFSEYAFATPDDIRLYPILSTLQNREIILLHRILSNNQVAVLELLSTEAKAFKDIDVAEGTFPLLVYHSDFSSGIAENAVLCEYLASHGFVVAAAHSFGAIPRRPEPAPADLAALVEDMGFVTATLRDIGFIDHGRLGVLGYRLGALAGLLFQMHNYNVDAIAALAIGSAQDEHMEMGVSSPYYDTTRMTVPMLEIQPGAAEGYDSTFVEPFRYAPRYVLNVPDARAANLTTYSLMPAAFLGSEEAQGGPELYRAMCVYVRRFFDAHLNGDEESLAFLGRSPAENGLAPDVSVVRMAAEDRPPTQDEFMAILQQGMVDTAIALYDRFTALDPDLVMFPEAQMNMAGYRLLQAGRAEEAVTLFRMNARTYGQSANCWDSLTEAYIAIGDTEHALECVDKVIETLPGDANISENLREQLRSNAEHYRQMLTEQEGEAEGETDEDGSQSDREE